MPKFLLIGIVAEGMSIDIDGLNIWEHEWKTIPTSAISLPHPQYASQKHTYHLYEIIDGNRRVSFAAGELSANVWGFYKPASD